jgi:cytidyltransferase-like protein
MKIIYADIVGDLFHYGHVAFLRKCKEKGDYLIVGVSSDDDVASYKRVPIMTCEERCKTIMGCRYVDEVIPNAICPIDEEFLNKYKIDIVIHGNDMSKEDLDYWYQCPIKLNKFETVSYTESISTSEIIRRLMRRIDDGSL